MARKLSNRNAAKIADITAHGLPIWLKGRTEQLLSLGNSRSGTQTQLGLMLSLQRRVDRDWDLLNGSGLQRSEEGNKDKQTACELHKHSS